MSLEKEVTLWADIVAERRRSDHPWVDFTWRPVALLPCQNATDNDLADNGTIPRQIESGDGWERFLVGRLPINLHHKETEAYLENLSAARPALYVILEQDGDSGMVRPKRATASSFEAQDYLDAGEDILEALPIPAPLHALIEAFIAEHHKASIFKKRKRVPFSDDAPIFGKQLHPIEAKFYKRDGGKKPK